MATVPDPYRTLGLPRTATLDEVKRAYRRLAKANHPDAAGEAALPRFLAIQAAYDQIAGPDAARGFNPRGATRRPGSRPAWDADPDRADATRRAYGNRARARPSAARPPRDAGAAGADVPPRADGPSASAGTAAGQTGARSGTPGARSRRTRRATLGSTSYDEAEEGPFEPGWGGASWYGTSSGTYWTLNPKEYADPRKHGPEYQARARRASRAEPHPNGPVEASADGSASGDGPPIDDNLGRTEAPSPNAPPPGHSTRSWWDATAGGPAAAPAQTAGDSSDARPSTRTHPDAAASPSDQGRRRDPGPPTIDALRAWLASDNPGVVVRLGRAAIGWAPIALGIGWLAGELTGCGRFSASCDASAAPVAWFAQVVALALLLVVPALARIAAIAAVATIAAAVAATFLLTATGSSYDRDWGRLALGGTLLIAWMVGLAYAVVREVRILREARADAVPAVAADSNAGPRDDSAARGGPVS